MWMRNGIHPAWVGALPMACAATCRVSISVQEMAVEAALTGDRELVKLAVLHDPLTGAVCNPEEVWAMCDEMFEALAPWMPQFNGQGATYPDVATLQRRHATLAQAGRRLSPAEHAVGIKPPRHQGHQEQE